MTAAFSYFTQCLPCADTGYVFRTTTVDRWVTWVPCPHCRPHNAVSATRPTG